MPEPSLNDLQEKVGDEFWHAGGCTGSMARDCRHGVCFFHDDEQAGDWEDGELIRLRARAAENPDKYVPLDHDAHFTELCGFEWCWDCEKCLKEAIKYQSFIWNNRFAIASFLNAKLAAVAKQAVEEKERLTVGKV